MEGGRETRGLAAWLAPVLLLAVVAALALLATVPKLRSCHCCGGRGALEIHFNELPSGNFSTCPVCEGAGRVTVLEHWRGWTP